MKVKKLIGQEINGFKILNSYAVNLPSGAKTRKVLVKCIKCGREFERNSGNDFKHIKCKCMCRPEPEHHKMYELDGVEYSLTDICKNHDIPTGTFRSRLKRGMSIKEALQHSYIVNCDVCGKEFESSNTGVKYCCNTCRNRGMHSKGPYKEIEVKECVVCGKPYRSNHYNSKTCSEKCRKDLDRISRNGRYKKLKLEGRFDESVTLRNVYDKYDGICQGCNNKLSFDLDWLDDNYPSIDHIYPLSKGGSHSWNNVQLLCRKCNYMKSDN